MEKFQKLQSPAVPLARDNVDTDMIIPAELCKVFPDDVMAFGKSLFWNLRFHADGTPDPTCVLSLPQYRDAKILVAGDNFACGSSREIAVWALMGYGFRCVIAESFGDIFYNSSFRMGLLPIVLPYAGFQALREAVIAADGARPTIVDLEMQTVTGPDGVVRHFDIEAMRRRTLLEGLDGVDVTLLRADEIDRFEKADRADRPWIHKFRTLETAAAPPSRS
jgi:3-isopropylmalate/(R)-2-methylmalate dehydratase small subunit